MNNEDITIEKDGAEQAASTWAKVGKKSQPKGSLLSKNKPAIIIGGVVVAFVLVIMLPGHKKQTVKNPMLTKQSNLMNSGPMSDNELNQNLSKIHQMESLMQNTVPGSLLSHSKSSKEMLARQNAPSEMFTSGGNAPLAGALNNMNKPVQATFAGHDTYSEFANQTTGSSSTVQATKIAHPEYSIPTGEFLHAVLEPAIDSDLPGELRAIVSQPVYSLTGEHVLIPRGSSLIGQYSSATLQGQNRVFIMWNRVILPNGITANINSSGVDAIGQSGVGADSVNTHFFTRFGTAALLSILGAASANGGVDNMDQMNSSSEYRTAIAQSFQQSAQSSLQSSEQTKPTLRVFQGKEINVFVSHDIDFNNVLNTNASNNDLQGIS